MNNDEIIRMLARLAAHREGLRLMLGSIQALLRSLPSPQHAQSYAAQFRSVLKLWRGELLSLPQIGMTDEQQQLGSETIRATAEDIASQFEAVLDEFDVPGGAKASH